MSQPRVQLLSELLRSVEVECGTSDMARMVFHSLKEAILHLKAEENKEFYKEFKALVKNIHRTEPRYAILSYYTNKLLAAFDEIRKSDIDYKAWAVEQLEKIEQEMDNNTNQIIRHSESINLHKKTILLHDHSHTVHGVLVNQKKLGRKFKVIIAEQETEKTEENIEVLHKSRIPFQVVPDYMISHIHESVDMVFFGALTMKDTMHFVMDPGAYGVISQFKSLKVPIYVFIKDTKFSYWKSKPRGGIYFKKHKRNHCSHAIEYDRIKYSHDRVPVDLFHRIVTNSGVFAPAKLKEIFQKNYKMYEKKGEI